MDYVATQDKAENGAVIYHGRNGKRGRPPRFVQDEKGEYVPYKGEVVRAAVAPVAAAV